MDDEKRIPTFQLDADSLGRNHYFDAWRETVRCVYDVEPLSGDDCVQERIDGWLLARIPQMNGASDQ